MKTLIYIPKSKPYLYQIYNRFIISDFKGKSEFKDNFLNGKVVASFELNLIEQLRWNNDLDVVFTRFESKKSILEKSCLTFEQLCDYVGNKEAYAWHIKDLVVFDEAVELGELYKDWDIFDTDSNGKYVGDYVQVISVVKKAPQSYQYVYYKGEKCLLVSIRAEHAINILQGNKTLEIRKSVPRLVKEAEDE
jgi:predicted transcriptional regulator